jgi:CHASE3 domain sensor protein
MQITMIHNQNSAYPTPQTPLVHANLATTRPIPATTIHQPVQRSSTPVERITQPEQRAKLARAIHAFAKDEFESLGYVVRRPDPRDRRAKLIVLTGKGRACVEAARATIEDLEDEIIRRLGQRGHHQLRRMLQKLLDAE